VLKCKQLYAEQQWMSGFHACAVTSLSQYTSDVILLPYCMNSTIRAPFLPQENSCHEFSWQTITVLTFSP
jgi:hypothetical protein